MVGEKAVRQALRVYCTAASKVKVGSEKYILFSGMVLALGWVLEEPEFARNFETIIKEVMPNLGVVYSDKESG